MIGAREADSFIENLEKIRLRGPALRRAVVQRLSELPNYNWSGIYRLENNTLVLDEFVGDDTEHIRIPVGVGVCGTAVAENKNQVIEDVRTLENYLACSLKTRSEIVVLIKNDGKTLGQIDVDGHKVAAFDSSDEAFLTRLADLIGAGWE